MAEIRVNKTDNYTVMSNYHLRDKKLSLKAKGLLSQMLSLPPDWDYTVAGLAAINKEQESAIISALKELKQYGYLTVTKIFPSKDNGGRIDYIYDIYEQPAEKQPAEKQTVEKQGVENQGVEFQRVENQGQINKDKLNKDKINKDKINRFIAPAAVRTLERNEQKAGGSFDTEEFFNKAVQATLKKWDKKFEKNHKNY